MPLKRGRDVLLPNDRTADSEDEAMVRNPKTNRMVKANGAIGLAIINAKLLRESCFSEGSSSKQARKSEQVNQAETVKEGGKQPLLSNGGVPKEKATFSFGTAPSSRLLSADALSSARSAAAAGCFSFGMIQPTDKSLSLASSARPRNKTVRSKNVLAEPRAVLGQGWYSHFSPSDSNKILDKRRRVLRAVLFCMRIKLTSERTRDNTHTGMSLEFSDMDV